MMLEGSAVADTGQASVALKELIAGVRRIVRVSIHIYGANLAELGCNIRRHYDLPLLPISVNTQSAPLTKNLERDAFRLSRLPETTRR